MEDKSTFKHPQSLKKINYLEDYLPDYEKEEVKLINFTERKYIKDYIGIYFYRQNVNIHSFLKGYESLGMDEKAK